MSDEPKKRKRRQSVSGKISLRADPDQIPAATPFQQWTPHFESTSIHVQPHILADENGVRQKRKEIIIFFVTQ
jgi:hypothetical protein